MGVHYPAKTWAVVAVMMAAQGYLVLSATA